MLNLRKLLTFQSVSTPRPSLPAYSAYAGTCTLTLHQPRLDVRLCIANGYHSLYSFHPHAYKAPFPGYFFLRSPSQAEIIYILGPDWRSQLITPSSNNRFLKTLSYIPLKPDTFENEPEIFLKMRRSRAVRFVESFDLSMLHNPDFDGQEAENQIMGWPDEGGLWVLRFPPRRRYLMEEWIAIFGAWRRGGGSGHDTA